MSTSEELSKIESTGEITVNILELASELASKATFDELVTNGSLEEEDLFIKPDHENYDEDCSYYSDEAQDVFNVWYDYFYDVILNCKV